MPGAVTVGQSRVEVRVWSVLRGLPAPHTDPGRHSVDLAHGIVVLGGLRFRIKV